MKNFKLPLLILFITIFTFSCNTDEQIEISQPEIKETQPASIGSNNFKSSIIDFNGEFYLDNDELAAIIEDPTSEESFQKINLGGQESITQGMEFKLVPCSEVDLTDNCSPIGISSSDICCSTNILNCPEEPRFVFPTSCFEWVFEAYDVRQHWSWRWEGETGTVGSSTSLSPSPLGGCSFSPIIECGPFTFLIFRSLENTDPCPRTLIYTTWVQYKMNFGNTVKIIKCGESSFTTEVEGTDPDCEDQ